MTNTTTQKEKRVLFDLGFPFELPFYVLFYNILIYQFNRDFTPTLLCVYVSSSSMMLACIASCYSIRNVVCSTMGNRENVSYKASLYAHYYR
jgi:hypothetical protein